MAIKIIPKEEMLNQKGTKFDPGAWVTLDQERINAFTDHDVLWRNAVMRGERCAQIIAFGIGVHPDLGRGFLHGINRAG